MQEVRPRDVSASRGEDVPGRSPERICQRRGDLLRVVKRGVGEYLMHVGAVQVSRLVGKAVPTIVVEVSEMPFVLGVDYLSRARSNPSAASRFCNCDRDVSHRTCNPDGRCVSSTVDSVLLRFCPPGPVP